MTNLTHAEAQAVLNQLRSLSITDIIDNNPLLDAIRKLNTIPAMINVSFRVRDNDKITAIKMYRQAAGVGLKEAKDEVERQWGRYTNSEGWVGEGWVSLGAMSHVAYDALIHKINNDPYSTSYSHHGIEWFTE